MSHENFNIFLEAFQPATMPGEHTKLMTTEEVFNLLSDHDPGIEYDEIPVLLKENGFSARMDPLEDEFKWLVKRIV